MTAYESCAMMTPVVSADVGGQSDLIDNSVGRIIPCLQREEDMLQTTYGDEEVGLYSSAILDLLSPDYAIEYQKISSACREKIIARFGLDSMINNMETAIEKCFSEERKKQRYELSIILKKIPRLTEDVLGMYSAYESVEQESGISWRQCNYIESLKNEQLIQKEQSVQALRTELECMKNSLSFKVGRVITWGPRKIRGGYMCIKEHGLIYTLKLALEKAKFIISV